MKKFLKAVSLLLAGIIISIPFTSCSGNKPDEYGAVYNQKGTLVISWPEDGTDILEDAWDDYCRLNGKNDLKINIIPDYAIYDEDKFSSNLPDILCVNSVTGDRLFQDKYIMDLSEYNAMDLKDKFADNSWDTVLYQSSIYGIPFYVFTSLFGAKKDSLGAEKITLPKTYEELLSAGDKLKANNKKIAGHYLFYDIIPYIWSLGGEVMNEDGTEAVFNTPETGVRAFEMLLEMKKKGFFEEDWDYFEENQNGNVVFEDINSKPENIDDIYYGLKPELKQGVPGYSIKESCCLSIKKDSVNKDLAYDFMKYLITEKNAVTGITYQEEYFEKFNFGIPTLKDVQENLSNSDDFFRLYIEQLNYSKRFPQSIAGSNIINETFYNAIDAVYNGRNTPEQAVKEAQKEINAAIKRKLRDQEME